MSNSKKSKKTDSNSSKQALDNLNFSTSEDLGANILPSDKSVVEPDNTDINNLQPQKKTVVLVLSSDVFSELADLSLLFWHKYFSEYEILIAGGKYKDFPILEHEISGDADINFANILASCVSDDRVSEEFVLSPITSFPLRSVSLSEIGLLKCRSSLLKYQVEKNRVCLRELPDVAVIEALKREGIASAINYETEMPVLFSKENLATLFERFFPQRYPYLIRSLYFNFFNRSASSIPILYDGDKYSVGVFRSDPDIEKVTTALSVSGFFVIRKKGYPAFFKLRELLEARLQ